MNALRISIFCVVCSVFVSFFAAGQTKSEKSSAYGIWLTNDVGYIITDEERAAFNRLQNDEEREQFIKQFWLRRDPTPDTLENEFKEEHYRRIAYANERFASGMPGWKTDRGRIYIVFGPPDEIESHPSGGSYTRPPEQGGGNTSTFPFEQWRYRHIDDIGSDIIVEFVDPTMSGEYRMSIDPSEKDALLHVPGASRSQDNTRSDTERTNQFNRLEQFSKLFQAPKSRFRDLETAFVSSGIRYSILPMKVRVDVFPVTEASVLTCVAIQVDNKDLQFQAKDGIQKATVNILGRISTMNRRTAALFEDTVVVESPNQMLDAVTQHKSIYGKCLPMPPGAYRLDVAGKDSVGGNLGTYQAAIVVPRLDAEKLQSSSIVLADAIESVSTRNTGAGQFVIGDSKVRPRVDAVFHRDEKMGVYLKIYNLGTNGQVEYELVKSASNEKVFDSIEDFSQIPNAAASQATIKKLFDLRGLTPGQYTVRIKITDKGRGQILSPSVAFSVI